MVHLFNISLKNDEISCDYTPETSDKSGHITVDAKTYEIKDVKFSDYEYGKNMYVSHVRLELEKMLNSKDSIPKETTIVWY